MFEIGLIILMLCYKYTKSVAHEIEVENKVQRQAAVTAHSSSYCCLALQCRYAWVEAGPDGSFVSTEACNLEVPGSSSGRAGYLTSWLCICSVPNCSKVWIVQCCLWDCTINTDKEPLNLFEIRVGHRPGFRLPSVAISPWLCRKRRKAIFIHSAGWVGLNR